MGDKKIQKALEYLKKNIKKLFVCNSPILGFRRRGKGSFGAILFLFLITLPAVAFTPLPADKAFHFSATISAQHRVVLRWEIAPGYYLYRDRISVSPTATQIIFPKGVLHAHEQVYKRVLKIPVDIQRAPNGNVLLNIHYQGCAEAGFCYAPNAKIIRVDLSAEGFPTQLHFDLSVQPPETNKFAHYLMGNHFIMFIVFLGMGLLLSLTPCILPMVPILSAIIVGHRRKKPNKKAFFLSLTYVLGSVVTYAIAGVVIAGIGHNIQSALQQPWVIIAASMVFVLLALSLLGLYDFRLPTRWQQKLADISYRQRGGTFLGVFLMGSLSTLIVSPCVSAPLVGVLAWIGQTGDMWLGGVALLALGFGMGVPLLLVGLSFDRYLPRTGYWMIVLERIFGVLMLCMAVWMLFRLVPSSQTYFKVIPDMPTLEQSLADAEQKHQPVILDFYADWCTSCVAMDKTLFARNKIHTALRGFKKLRIDITANDESTVAMLERFHVIGPPTILFADCDGHWLPALTLIGEINSQQLITQLQKIRNGDACLTTH
ncbi:MAG: protein-disulfide reductase DsbD [Gammaproteobacteria bacterium]|nr:protein-disulfide reductase DsbD [Gammaproteobacteria bacterium]